MICGKNMTDWRARLDDVEDENKMLLEALKQIIEAVDTGNLEMTSPETVMAGTPYPWHEEWLYRARAAIAKATSS